jgi:hypothetical protein
VVADIRHGLGLGDLNDEARAKNRAFAFTLGYAIPLTGK